MKKETLKLVFVWVAALWLAFPLCAHGQNFKLLEETQGTRHAEDVDERLNSRAQSQGPGEEAKDKARAAMTSTEQAPTYVPGKIYAQSQNSRYTLGPTDIIEVIVMRHPEVSGLYTINQEGKIQFEFVGDIDIAGFTKEEATEVVAKRLETYIISPDVTIKIAEYNSKVVYVVGEVGAPGKIFMRGDTITIRDALLSAGLPQLTASTDSATMFTPSADGKVIEKKVNVYALLYKGDLRQNYVMKPGDTLYLPATLWAKVARFLNPVTQPISQAAGTGSAVRGF